VVYSKGGMAATPYMGAEIDVYRAMAFVSGLLDPMVQSPHGRR